MGPSGEQPSDKFRILCVDGGGIRGLISALVIAEFERLLQERDGEGARIADYFHLFSGTSTGGLIALALTRPDPAPGSELAGFYTEDGPRIFHRSLARKLLTGWGVLDRSTAMGRCARRCSTGWATGTSPTRPARCSSPPTT
jgi:hypothetical protein